MKDTDSDDVTVYRLGSGCDLADIEEGNIYQGKVQGFANFGMFVQINDRIKGLVHKTNMKGEHTERDSILVRVRQIRPNGNIDLEEVIIQVYQVQNVDRKSTTVRIADLSGKIGEPSQSKARSPRSSRPADRPSSPSLTRPAPRTLPHLSKQASGHTRKPRWETW